VGKSSSRANGEAASRKRSMSSTKSPNSSQQLCFEFGSQFHRGAQCGQALRRRVESHKDSTNRKFARRHGHTRLSAFNPAAAASRFSLNSIRRASTF
jgi:hypothetical protein